MMRHDVTRKVQTLETLDTLCVTKCVCGATFEPWQFIITHHRIGASQCPACQRRLHYAGSRHIYEVRG